MNPALFCFKILTLSRPGPKESILFRKRFTTIAVLCLAFLTTAAAQSSHEYAPIEEKKVNYKDWTYPSLKEGEQPINLRQWMKDKKLVLVVYFAQWCPNWRNEAPFVAKLQEKYASQGLGIIAVSEYAGAADVRKHFGAAGAPYPVVIESESRDDREKTPHYNYRQLTGDQRRWGSPYNLFLDPAKISAGGEVLAERAWVANGELIEADAEKFVRERLAPAAADATAKP